MQKLTGLEEVVFSKKLERYNPAMSQTLNFLFKKKGLKQVQEESEIVAQLEQLFGKVTLNKESLKPRVFN